VALPEIAPPGAEVELWIPLPARSGEQRVSDLEIEGPGTVEVVRGARHGNRMAVLRGRAEEFSKARARVAFRVLRRAIQGGRPDEPGVDPSRYLGPDALVPIDGPIAERAERVAGARRDPLAVARALYDDVVEHLDYDKSGEGWGRGDALRACSVQRGNCTDFHSLFIGMCRARGIPARFAMGVPLPVDGTAGTIPGYHCWAEFHVDGRGWIPVDASEAAKHPERREFLFGNLDADRVEFTRGRDIVLPGHPELEPLNYLIHPVLLVGGELREGVRTTFEFRDLARDTGT